MPLGIFFLAMELSVYWFYFYKKTANSVRVGSVVVSLWQWFIEWHINNRHKLIFIFLKLTVKQEPSDWDNSKKGAALPVAVHLKNIYGTYINNQKDEIEKLRLSENALSWFISCTFLNIIPYILILFSTSLCLPSLPSKSI